MTLVLLGMGTASAWAQTEVVYSGNDWIEVLEYYDAEGNKLDIGDGNGLNDIRYLSDGDKYTKWNDANATTNGYSVVLRLNNHINMQTLTGFKIFSWSNRPTSVTVQSAPNNNAGSLTGAPSHTFENIQYSNDGYAWSDLLDYPFDSENLRGNFVKLTFSTTAEDGIIKVEDIFFVGTINTVGEDVHPLTATPTTTTSNGRTTSVYVYDLGADTYLNAVSKMSFTINDPSTPTTTVKVESSPDENEWTELKTTKDNDYTTLRLNDPYRLTGRYIRVTASDNDAAATVLENTYYTTFRDAATLPTSADRVLNTRYNADDGAYTYIVDLGANVDWTVVSKIAARFSGMRCEGQWMKIFTSTDGALNNSDKAGATETEIVDYQMNTASEHYFNVRGLLRGRYLRIWSTYAPSSMGRLLAPVVFIDNNIGTLPFVGDKELKTVTGTDVIDLGAGVDPTTVTRIKFVFPNVPAVGTTAQIYNASEDRPGGVNGSLPGEHSILTGIPITNKVFYVDVTGKLTERYVRLELSNYAVMPNAAVVYVASNGDEPANRDEKLASYGVNVVPVTSAGVEITSGDQKNVYDTNGDTKLQITGNTTLYFRVEETVPPKNISHIGLKFTENPHVNVQIKRTTKADGNGGWGFINNEGTDVDVNTKEYFMAFDGSKLTGISNIIRVIITKTDASPATINLEDITLYLTEEYTGGVTITDADKAIPQLAWDAASNDGVKPVRYQEFTTGETSVTPTFCVDGTYACSGVTKIHFHFDQEPNVKLTVMASKYDATTTGKFVTYATKDINTKDYYFDLTGKMAGHYLRFKMEQKDATVKNVGYSVTVYGTPKAVMKPVVEDRYISSEENKIVADFVASSAGKNPHNVMDGNFDSSWAGLNNGVYMGEGDYAYLVFKVKRGDITKLNKIELYRGTDKYRTAAFDLAVKSTYADGDLSATDGRWQSVLSDGEHAFATGDANPAVISSSGINTAVLTDDIQYIRLAIKSTDNGNPTIQELVLTTAGTIVYNGTTINHKRARAYDLYEGFVQPDNTQWPGLTDEQKASIEIDENVFYDKTDTDGLEANGMQKAHTLTEVIYVKPGTKVRLTLPDFLGEKLNNASYQRWYNYNTDGTFEVTRTGEGYPRDILTPTLQDDLKKDIGGTPPTNCYQGYRLKNGYVGSPLVTGENTGYFSAEFYFPTYTEAQNWFGYAAGSEPAEYIVACDASNGTDFTASYSNESKNSDFFDFINPSTTAYEPTLGHRFLYVIRNVDRVDEQPTDVRNITAPATRLPDMTSEVVALPYEARSYMRKNRAIIDPVDNPLVVTINNGTGTNTAGIELLTDNIRTGGVATSEVLLSGIQRNIFFRYPKTNADGTQSVYQPTDGSKPYAEIVVRNGEKVVVQFNITFEEETRLLTQSQLVAIRDGSEEYKNASWMGLNYRRPSVLEGEYTPLTQLTFDADAELGGVFNNIYTSAGEAGVEKQFLPFPMRWANSSYGFYDGGKHDMNNGRDPQPGVEWGYYAIRSGYYETSYHRPTDDARLNRNGLPSTFHLYVDASDRSGVVARLPFKEELCNGTELFITAWVKVARGDNNWQDNAGLLFTVLKQRQDGTQEVLHRHMTSQIPSTYSNYGNLTLPGFRASGQAATDAPNQWMQVYFSFVDETEDEAGAEYYLQVDNNSASTSGADFYVDDIRVYMATASAMVSQRKFDCDMEPNALMQMAVDWERMVSRMNINETTDGSGTIDFIFVDKLKYDEALPSGFATLDETARETAIATALNGSMVTVGKSGLTQTKISRMDYFNKFDSHAVYNNEALEQIAAYNPMNGSTGRFYFYRTGEGSKRRLQTDLYADLVQNRPYFMVMIPRAVNGTSSTVAEFADALEAEKCCLRTDFSITSRNGMRINGEVYDPSEEFCTGQRFTFSAEMRIPKWEKDADGNYIYNDEGYRMPDYDENGKQKYEVLDQGVVFFDWFIGTVDEFNTPESGLNLKDILEKFREYYPENTDLDGVVAQEGFTGAMLAVLKKIYEVDKKLVLRRDHLEWTIVAAGVDFVVCPIRTKIPNVGENTKDNDDDPDLICWDPIPLSLHPTTHISPEAVQGFSSIDYTKAIHDNPALRIGLRQIETARDGERDIVIDLRGVTMEDKYTHLEKIEGQAEVYLVRTDDPYYKKTTLSEDFMEQSLPIATIQGITVDKTAKSGTLTIRFNKDKAASGDQPAVEGFRPREGCTYSVVAYFKGNGAGVNDCYGSIHMDMKVVPEYVAWTGDETRNWNNDANWRRVAKTGDLKGATVDAKHVTDGLEADGTTKTNETAKAFVPMPFTNVVMPQDSRAQLYMAGFDNASPKLWSAPTTLPVGSMTEDIQFDLVAYGAVEADAGDGSQGLTTKPYRVNLCDEIHFNTGAQMLHSEQLLYNKVWMDVSVPVKRWTLMGMPLQNVVAGDWYTETATGSQAGLPLFNDVTFDSGNNRLNPAVYQRSWNDNATVYETAADNTGNAVTFTTGWSAAYNQADVPYTAGSGFSIKTATVNNAPSLVFRFPKSETHYTYPGTTFIKDNAHRLANYNNTYRSVATDDYTYVGASDAARTFTVTIPASGKPAGINGITGGDGRYIVVGNPFPAPMSVKAFLDANSGVLDGDYWTFGYNAGSKTYSYMGGNKWGNDYVIPPYGAFFAKLSNASAANADVTFNAGMQTFDATTVARSKGLTITASTASKRSTASLVFADGAADGYAQEDVPLLLDASLMGGDMPMVYTVADNRALSVNALPAAKGLIPLGVYMDEEETVTVTLAFAGVNDSTNNSTFKNAFVYDAFSDTSVPLHDGYELTLRGVSHGRYFLRFDDSATDITEAVAPVVEATLTAYSPVTRQVTVACDVPMRRVEVRAVNGALIAVRSEESGVGNDDASAPCAVTFDSVDSGVVIVRAHTAHGVLTKKIVVR